MRPEEQIDKIVKGAMNSFESPPPPDGWGRLERTLGSNIKGAVIPFRRRMLTIAAVVLAFVGGYFLAMMNSTDQPLVQDHTVALAENSDSKETRGSDMTKPMTGRTNSTDISTYVSGNNGNQSIRSSADGVTTIHGTTVQQPLQTPPQTLEVGVLLKDLSEPIPIIAMTELLPTLAFEIPYRIVHLGYLRNGQEPTFPATPIAPPDLNRPLTRWSVAGLAGQTISNYYHGTSMPMETGSYRNDLVTTTQEQLFNPLLSYGLGVGYNLTPTFGISTGLSVHQFSTPLINPTKAEYTVMSAEKPVANPLGEVQFNHQIKSSLSKSPQQEVFQGHYAQHLSYLEVPLTATWRLIDRRMGLGLRGGFGGNILQQNQVRFSEETGTVNVGTTDGVKLLYISGIIGADLSIRFNEHWRWSFVPVYRHALQSVSDTEYSPRIISFGLYSGLHFSF